MKNSFFVFVSAIFLMVVTSCVDNIEPPVAFSVNSMTICPGEQYSIVSNSDSSATAIDSLVASMPKTKAPVSSFPTDFGITLSAYYNASIGTSQAYFSGVNFSRNTSGVWAPSTTKYWPQAGSLNFLGFAKKDLTVSSVSWNADPSYQVSMAVGDNSSLQEDLMFCGAASVSKQTTAYPLTFRHAMANLQFTVAAPDGAYNSSDNTGITVSSIKLVNVYNSGTVTATRSASNVSFSWSSLGNQKNLTAPGISSASVATTATALGSGLVVVPQTCVGVQIEYVLHNGKDGAGTAVNTTRTYTYTPSGTWDAGNKYTIAFSIAQGQISATTSISAWTNATQTWFFATGDATSWVGANFPFSSATNMWWRLDGSSSYEQLVYEDGTWGNSVRFSTDLYYVTVTKSGSTYSVAYENKRPPIDLSMVEIDGTERGTRTTANSYIVKQAGRYDIPLVFGNAIVNGQTNSLAYTTSTSSSSLKFVDYNGSSITNPYIETSTGRTATKAALLWQTTQGMISTVELITGSDCKYIRFNVSQVPANNGVAVLAVYYNNIILWSWMIWVNGNNLSNVQYTNSNGAKYTFLSSILGGYKNASYYASCYYQAGRKDPFPSGPLGSVYDINGNTVSLTSSNTTGLYNLIRNPTDFCKGPSSSSYYGLTSQSYSNRGRHNNLWNAAYSGDADLTTKRDDQGQAIKTVYDPCPPGYMLPAGNAFEGVTVSSSSSGGYTVLQTNIPGVMFQLAGYAGAGGSSVYAWDIGSRTYLHTYAANYGNHYYYQFISNGSVSSSYRSGTQYAHSILPVKQPSTLFISSHAETFNSNDVTARTITVTSSETWTATLSDNSNWLLSSTGGTGNGSFTIRPRSNNNSGSNRTATITIAQSGHEPEVINLTQYYHIATSGIDCNVDRLNAFTQVEEERFIYFSVIDWDAESFDSGASYTRTRSTDVTSQCSYNSMSYFNVIVSESRVVVTGGSHGNYDRDDYSESISGTYNGRAFSSRTIWAHDCDFGFAFSGGNTQTITVAANEYWSRYRSELYGLRWESNFADGSLNIAQCGWVNADEYDSHYDRYFDRGYLNIDRDNTNWTYTHTTRLHFYSVEVKDLVDHCYRPIYIDITINSVAE